MLDLLFAANFAAMIYDTGSLDHVDFKPHQNPRVHNSEYALDQGLKRCELDLRNNRLASPHIFDGNHERCVVIHTFQGKYPQEEPQ